MSTVYRLVVFGSLQALAILLLFFNFTQVAYADLAELEPNGGTKGLLLYSGTLSPKVLLLGDDQLGVDEPKCFPGAKKKADECFNKTMVDVTQTTDLKKQCALYYNEWVLCSIAALCKCDYTIAHDFESKVKENVTSVVKNCTAYFKNYPFMSKDYCNKTDISSGPTTTTKNNQVMVTTDKSVTVPVQCPIDTTKAQEIDLKCSEMINKTFAGQSGPEVTCRKVYTSLLCTIDTNCKCSYTKTHTSEDKLKKDLKAAWKGQCEDYFKQYKYMSSYRCIETPENGPGSTTKRTPIWIIIGGTVGGVVGLVLFCCCIGVCCCGCVLCNRTDDKPTSGGRILGQVSSTSPMPAIPSSNAGGGGSTSKILAPSKSAAISKVSALPSSAAAAKAVTKTHSRGKGKGKMQKKVSKKRSSNKVASRSKLSNVGR